MTTAVFSKENGLFKGFALFGHAGRGGEGNDIVCAALSSAAYLAANTLSLDDKNAKINIGEGKITVYIEKVSDLSEKVLTALEFQLTDIQRQYPGNFRLCSLNSTGGKNNV